MTPLKTKPLSEIEQSVADFLATAGVTVTLSYCGTQTRSGWESDAWRVSIKRAGKGREWHTDYYTGLGHRSNLRPVTPCAAAPLSCLLLDASGADQNFQDWCADYGYDSDSVKALNVYTACCQTLADLRRMFSADERQTLADLLQDY